MHELLSAISLLPVLTSLLQPAGWKEVVTAVTFIPQIPEYVDDETKVVQLVLSVQTQLKSSNVRIRHAAWAALEQLSQDHADHLTIDTMAQQQLLEFLAGLDDPYKSVTSRADRRWSANCWSPSASLPNHNFHLHLQPLLPPSPPTTSTTTSTTTFTYYHNFHHHLQPLPHCLPLSTFTSNHNSHRLHLQPLPLTPTPLYTPFHRYLQPQLSPTTTTSITTSNHYLTAYPFPPSPPATTPTAFTSNHSCSLQHLFTFPDTFTSNFHLRHHPL